MKTLRIVVAIVVCIGGWATGAQAQHPDAGTTAAAFLKIGTDARAVGMGEAFVALGGDANSIYWNPAGLVDVTRRDVSFTYNKWLDDLWLVVVSYAHSLGRWGTAGFSFENLTMGDMQGIDVKGNPTEEFGASDWFLAASYAQEPVQNIMLGGVLKYIHQKIENESGGTAACDFGVMYRSPVEGLQFGGSLRNLGPKLTFVDEGARLPVQFDLGTSYNIPRLDPWMVILALSFQKPIDSRFRANLGVEAVFNELMSVRLGYKANRQEEDGLNLEGLTAGVGFQHKVTFRRTQFDLGGFQEKATEVSYRLDYAYGDFGVLGSAHRISVGFAF
jgi:hypothetical protein